MECIGVARDQRACQGEGAASLRHAADVEAPPIARDGAVRQGDGAAVGDAGRRHRGGRSRIRLLPETVLLVSSPGGRRWPRRRRLPSTEPLPETVLWVSVRVPLLDTPHASAAITGELPETVLWVRVSRTAVACRRRSRRRSRRQPAPLPETVLWVRVRPCRC